MTEPTGETGLRAAAGAGPPPSPDFPVVGAGIAGATAGYLLARHGTVTVLAALVAGEPPPAALAPVVPALSPARTDGASVRRTAPKP